MAGCRYVLLVRTYKTILHLPLEHVIASTIYEYFEITQMFKLSKLSELTVSAGCRLNILATSLICPRCPTAKVGEHYSETACARIRESRGHQSRFNLGCRTQLSHVLAITASSSQLDLTSVVRGWKMALFGDLTVKLINVLSEL